MSLSALFPPTETMGFGQKPRRVRDGDLAAVRHTTVIFIAMAAAMLFATMISAALIVSERF